MYLRVFGAGGVATAVTKTCLAPLERAKLLLQTQRISKTPEQEQYRTLREYLLKVPKQEGWFAYWRGNPASIFKLVPSSLTKFWMHFRIRNYIVSPETNYPTSEKFIRELAASALSGSVSMAACYPFDLARTRLGCEVTKKEVSRVYLGFMDCLSKTMRDQGIKGMYKGFVFSLGTQVPYMALVMTLYDGILKVKQTPDFQNNILLWDYPVVKYISAGSTAAILAQAIFYPADTIRRRLQVSGARGHHEGYLNAFHVVSNTLRHEGIAGFYRGCLVNIFRAFPGVAIQLAVYQRLTETRHH